MGIIVWVYSCIPSAYEGEVRVTTSTIEKRCVVVFAFALAVKFLKRCLPFSFNLESTCRNAKKFLQDME